MQGQEPQPYPAPANCSCLLLLHGLLIHGPVFLLPQIKAAQQGCYVLKSFRFELGHRTGGRMFLHSRTIRDDHLVARQFVQMAQDFARGNEFRSGNVSHVV